MARGQGVPPSPKGGLRDKGGQSAPPTSDSHPLSHRASTHTHPHHPFEVAVSPGLVGCCPPSPAPQPVGGGLPAAPDLRARAGGRGGGKSGCRRLCNDAAWWKHSKARRALAPAHSPGQDRPFNSAPLLRGKPPTPGSHAKKNSLCS